MSDYFWPSAGQFAKLAPLLPNDTRGVACVDDRRVAFLLSGGQVVDCTAAEALLDRMPKTRILHGDKGYDSDAVRRKIEDVGTALNIPPKVNRRDGNPAFRPRCIATATPSNACSHASRTSEGSQRDTTG